MSAWAEAGEERTNREVVITDLLGAQYLNSCERSPYSAGNRSRELSEEVADELAERLAMGARASAVAGELSRRSW